MSQVVTLFKNISWVTISQVVSNICAFIWTILIARYLGVTDYGILSFVIDKSRRCDLDRSAERYGLF